MLEDLIVTSEESANVSSTASPGSAKTTGSKNGNTNCEKRNVDEATSRKIEGVDDSNRVDDEDVAKKPESATKIPELVTKDLIVTSEESANVSSTASPGSAKTTGSKNGNTNCEKRNVDEATSRKIEGVDDSNRVDDDDVAKKPESATKIPELVTKGNGRIHGDAVLKILMQKVRLLEKNLSLLEDYIKELNKRQGDVLPQVDVELLKYKSVVEKARLEVKELLLWKASMVSCFRFVKF
uniref:Uncharacterized protein n=1 Tax=Tanacetum cinerariifolium TaxID=118510 RepID=A0A699RB25_TANCI|nr:hypothetical protein [Tanacetum cinerariifolium]